MSDRTTDVWTEAALEQNRRALLRYVLAATGSVATAEDLVQDTLRLAYEKRERLTPGTELGAWLRGIARNLLKRHFESQKKEPILVGDAFEELECAARNEEGSLTDGDLQERRIKALSACYEHLQEKARLVMEHRYGQGKSAGQVANLLGMTVAAVNVMAFRIRGVLAECVQKRMIS